MYTKLVIAFKYDENGQAVQLMTDKKAIILSARGGIYSTPEAAPMEMAANYIKNVFGGVFGMQIIDEVIIEGHAAAPDQAEAIIAEGLEKVCRSSKRFDSAVKKLIFIPMHLILLSNVMVFKLFHIDP